MTDLIIKGNPRSTYVRTSRMACIEKGVEYQLDADVDFKSDAYRAEYHPFGKIPVLVHGDVQLYESLAITSYIDSAFDGPALVPDDPVRRAVTFQWISNILSYMYKDLVVDFVLQFVIPRGPDGGPDMAVIGDATPRVKRDLKLIDDQLASRTFVTGDDPTLADLYIAPIMFYMSVLPPGKELLAACKNIPRTGAAMAERASYASTVPPMG